MKYKDKNLSWRTAPRSAIKTVEWFKSIEAIIGENWKDTSGKSNKAGKLIHPVKRKFLCAIANNEVIKNDQLSQKILNVGIENFMKGTMDWGTDPESDARQRISTFRQFGFLQNGDIIQPTSVGETILNNTFNVDKFIAQLLKMYTPLNNGGGIYIFQEFLKLINKYKALNRWEIAFIFLVNSNEDISNLPKAINEFRKNYEKHKSNNKLNKEIWKITGKKYFSRKWTKPEEKDKGATFQSYADAFSRSLVFTDLFIDSGRSNFTKIRIREIEKDKVNMLLNMKVSVPDSKKSSEEQMDWFGNVNNITLPWYNQPELKEIVINKLKNIRQSFPDEYKKIHNKFFNKKSTIDNMSTNSLNDVSQFIDKLLTSQKTIQFIKKDSKTKKVHDEIIKKYKLINGKDSQAIDMRALWLEVNTWRFFASLADDPKSVKYNGKLNPDLTPRSFAPGVNNTSDMEVYSDNSIILPEVSLMSGTQQWEHEGSSIAEHVYRKKEKDVNKDVSSIFISQKTNFRTMWMFFILNKDSWAGYPINIIPIDIDHFIKIVEFSYQNNLKLSDIVSLINKLKETVKEIDNFKEWQKHLNNKEKEWELTYKNNNHSKGGITQ